MNDLTTQNHDGNPFQRALVASSVNSGAVSIESERAIAEAQGKLIIAKRFPRDINASHAELMAACKSKAFAAVAFYSKPQGGKFITGPSIRLAEQIAQVYENFDCGHRELSRDDKKSEVEVYAWDMQKNNYSRRQKTVMHVIDTKEGPRAMRDQSQIDSKINNIASKEMRGLILAMMPKWLVEDAIQECKKTLGGTNDEPIDVRVRKMTQAFAKFGVKASHLEKHLGHSLDTVMIDELVDLTGVFNALKDGENPSEYFKADEADADAKEASPAKTAIAAAAAKGNETVAAAKAATEQAKPAPKPAAKAKPAPAPEPEPAAEPQDAGGPAPWPDDGDAQGGADDDVF